MFKFDPKKTVFVHFLLESTMCSCCTIHALSAGMSLDVVNIEVVTHAVICQPSSDDLVFPRLIILYVLTHDYPTIT